MPQPNQIRSSRPLRVAYFDGAVAYGGSLQVLSMLFGALDRKQVTPSLIACVPEQQLNTKFERPDVGLLCNTRLSYVERERWMRRLENRGPLLRRLGAYLFTLAAAVAALPNQLQLFLHLYKTRPDLLHVNNSFTPLPAARLLGIPVIWHLHGIPYRPSPWEHFLLKGVTKFIAISDYVAQAAIKAGCPAERMVTIHNPAPDFKPPAHDVRQWLLDKYSIPSDHLLLAHVGRLIRWKGQREFLEAFAIAIRDFPKATALIIGDDAECFGDNYAAELKALVASSGLSDNVVFTGHLNQIQNVMAAVDVVVHSSIEPEPFGLVIVEAMKAGTAVIAADHGAPPEIIEHEISGILENPRSARSMAATLTRLLSDEKMRGEIASAGQRHAKARFSSELFGSRLTNLYRSISGNS